MEANSHESMGGIDPHFLGKALVLNPVLIEKAFDLACKAAEEFHGQTAPNPTVGACGLDSDGNILSVQAHAKPGEPHAEVLVIQDCQARSCLSKLYALVVTLEPCNHQGRTPACTAALLGTPLKKIYIGVRDPNPQVVGGGAEVLQKAGWETNFAEGESQRKCQLLIAPFKKVVTSGFPYVTVKIAQYPSGDMIPPPGQKTFMGEESLKMAHRLRRQADAILTGSGTVLADRPLFTVRRVPDFPNKKRDLVILDRQKRVPKSYIDDASHRFKVFIENDLEQALKNIAKRGGLEVLVEAGPRLTQAIIQSSFWDRSVIMTKGTEGDRIETRFRDPRV